MNSVHIDIGIYWGTLSQISAPKMPLLKYYFLGKDIPYCPLLKHYSSSPPKHLPSFILPHSIYHHLTCIYCLFLHSPTDQNRSCMKGGALPICCYIHSTLNIPWHAIKCMR